MNLFSHPGCHSLRGKVCSSVDVEATGRVSWPDVGCGGRGFPAWLAAVGARGIGVLLALEELSRQGAHLLGPVLPKSDQDLQTAAPQMHHCAARGLSGGAPHLAPANLADGPTMRPGCLGDERMDQCHGL